jgi:Fic family protein
MPIAMPQRLDELFRIILSMAKEISDPIEQAFFVMVHLPYLQPFEDVNKRVSRLAANIPLIRHNLCSLSFIDVPELAYIDAMLGSARSRSAGSTPLSSFLFACSQSAVKHISEIIFAT